MAQESQNPGEQGDFLDVPKVISHQKKGQNKKQIGEYARRVSAAVMMTLAAASCGGEIEIQKENIRSTGTPDFDMDDEPGTGNAEANEVDAGDSKGSDNDTGGSKGGNSDAGNSHVGDIDAGGAKGGDIDAGGSKDGNIDAGGTH